MYGENAILNHMKRIFGGGGLRPSNTGKVDSFLIYLLIKFMEKSFVEKGW